MNQILDLYEMRAIVKGNVQGVGFRALTRYLAADMGITGTVRNLPDGSVEICAYGSKRKLEELMRTLKEKTAPGSIKGTEIEYAPIDVPHKDFRVIH